MYDMKALYEATSVDHAIELLQNHPEALVIAGGSDVLIQMREGKLAGKEFVSIYALDELRGVTKDDDGTIRIGSLTSFSHVMKSELVQKHIPVLGEAVSTIGGPQIRNIGTIGGNTCNGVTSADSASTLLAFDAELELRGPEGKRILPLRDFYIRPGVVALKPAELQVAILIRKKAYEGYRGHYIKYAMRNAMDIATLGCSVNVKLSDDKKTIDDCRIAFGVAGPVPMRVPQAEDFIRGKIISDDLINECAEKTLEDVNPRTSWRASKEFRLHLIETMTRRALTEAIRRSEGVYA
jgi:xanthine dehydrogenase FAD-binding subunit